MTQIKSYEAACLQEGRNPNLLPEVAHLHPDDQKSTIAHYKWDIIVQALNNEGQEKPWKADYNDFSQRKYEMRIYKETPSSGWSLVVVVGWNANTGTICGARRVFRDASVVRNAFKYFLEDYLATF